jgi:hypothetical protein
MKLGITFSILFFLAINVFSKDKEPAKSKDAKIDITKTTQELNANDTKDGYQKIDMNQFKDVNAPMKSKSSANLRCRSQVGTEYRPTDPEFESCVKQNALDKAKSPKGNPGETSMEFQFNN